MNLCLSTHKLALFTCAFSFLAFSGSLVAGGAGAGQNDGTGLSGPPHMNVTYASREPRRCKSVTAPPDQAQAAALIQCTMEVAGSIGARLKQNVKVEISAPRSFQPELDGRLQEIDAQAPIYPLSGSMTEYMCNSVAFGLYHAGSNCSVSPMPQGLGKCWKTTFGDWKCNLEGPTPDSRSGQPGPTTY